MEITQKLPFCCRFLPFFCHNFFDVPSCLPPWRGVVLGFAYGLADEPQRTVRNQIWPSLRRTARKPNCLFLEGCGYQAPMPTGSDRIRPDSTGSDWIRPEIFYGFHPCRIFGCGSSSVQCIAFKDCFIWLQDVFP